MFKNKLRAFFVVLALFSFVSRPVTLQADVNPCAVTLLVAISSAILFSTPIIVVNDEKFKYDYQCLGDEVYPWCCTLHWQGSLSDCTVASNANENCDNGQEIRCLTFQEGANLTNPIGSAPTKSQAPYVTPVNGLFGALTAIAGAVMIGSGLTLAITAGG